MIKKCQLCFVEFSTTDKRRKFCSLKCSNIGQKRPNTFKKGNIPWDTGKKMSKEFSEKIRLTRLGSKDTLKTKENKSKGLKKYWKSSRSKNRIVLKGIKHPNWKGTKVSYWNCHKWVQKNFSKTGICEICNRKGYTEWSNRDHKYIRIRSDWQEVCRSCHLKYDRIK